MSHRQTMLVPERPPIIIANLPEEIALARLAVARIDRQQMSRSLDSRWARVDSLPFLTSTEVGRQFLAAAAPRVLARGTPEEACPALAMASGAGMTLTGDEAQKRGEVAAVALANCLRQLPADVAICGCRVIAVDDMVTVPREQVVYATGTSARLRAPKLGLDLLLVAEDGPDARTVLRDLRGPVAWIDREGDHRVTLRLKDSGRVFEGRSIPVGFRRGRLAERIYAEDGDGEKLSLLIGFDPDELSQHAAAWLAWPKDG